MNCHTIVRMTNDTKNGTSSIRRKKFFLRPAWNAIQYAIGNATMRSMIVAAPENFSELSSCEWYRLSSCGISPQCHTMVHAPVAPLQRGNDSDGIVATAVRNSARG